jgi:hypothetical protein
LVELVLNDSVLDDVSVMASAQGIARNVTLDKLSIAGLYERFLLMSPRGFWMR